MNSLLYMFMTIYHTNQKLMPENLMPNFVVRNEVKYAATWLI